ncbi:hypothetical protein, partial [Pseudomonas cannabina]|uniref:hypothetical protein n=1 Tax=Pseudomonas cannabina TaxID=86840 RepID=UPI001C3F3A21
CLHPPNNPDNSGYQGILLHHTEVNIEYPLRFFPPEKLINSQANRADFSPAWLLCGAPDSAGGNKWLVSNPE